MSLTGRRPAHGLESWALSLLWVGLSGWLGPTAAAKEANQPICCRSSGGTRSTCLNVWAHLVPSSNRFGPGANRLIALLQGSSPQPTAMTLQFSTPAGELLGEQTLAALGEGIRLLTLSGSTASGLKTPLVWESFPSCRPNKPPTRSTLIPGTALPMDDPSQQALAQLGESCGGSVATAPLLRVFGMEEFIAKLPPTLQVRCEVLSIEAGGISSPQGSGSRP
ncbi:MAG: hypothetical protein ACK59A_08720 [Cyanobacteriota bacterium]|jgi:hypothetical protein